MSAFWIMVIGLGVLSTASGMLGLGVAFSAVPFLALFLPDLVHQVQPLSLLLNGITALFAVFGFAQSGYMDWRKAMTLAVVTTVSAPFGAWLVQYTPVMIVWAAYLASVIYLAYRLFPLLLFFCPIWFIRSSPCRSCLTGSRPCLPSSALPRAVIWTGEKL